MPATQRMLINSSFTGATPTASVETRFAYLTVPKNFVYKFSSREPSTVRVGICENITSSTAKVCTTTYAKIATPCSRWQTAGSLLGGGASDQLDKGASGFPGLVFQAYKAADASFDVTASISYANSTGTVTTNASTAMYCHYLPVGMEIQLKAISPQPADEEVIQLLGSWDTTYLAMMDNIGASAGEHSLVTFGDDAWFPGQFRIEFRVNDAHGAYVDFNMAAGTYGRAITFLEIPVWTYSIDEFALLVKKQRPDVITGRTAETRRKELLRHKLKMMARLA